MAQTHLNQVSIVIVGYRCPVEIKECLAALDRSTGTSTFDVLITENGGSAAYHDLVAALLSGPCHSEETDRLDTAPFHPGGRLIDMTCMSLKGRASRVWVARASGNLGYAAAINEWLERLSKLPDWRGVWVLNPDTEPEPGALQALVDRAQTTQKAMVGSTVVAFEQREQVHCRGGLYWRFSRASPALIGFHDRLNSTYDVEAIERSMDAISGASVYVTREGIEKIGLLDEAYFLYYEDIDWGFRGKPFGLAYASASVIPHKHGATIGSASSRRERSRLSVYLEYRNRINFARKHFPKRILVIAFITLAHTAEYLLAWAPANFWTALEGLFAGLRGEVGPPKWLKQ